MGNDLFTTLSILWIIFLIAVFNETSLLKKHLDAIRLIMRHLTSLTTAIGLGILFFYIRNIIGNFNIQNLVTTIIVVVVIFLTTCLFFIDITENKPSSIKKLLWTRNTLAVLSAIAVFVHFFIFNVFAYF